MSTLDCLDKKKAMMDDLAELKRFVDAIAKGFPGTGAFLTRINELIGQLQTHQDFFLYKNQSEEIRQLVQSKENMRAAHRQEKAGLDAAIKVLERRVEVLKVDKDRFERATEILERLNEWYADPKESDWSLDDLVEQVHKWIDGDNDDDIPF